VASDDAAANSIPLGGSIDIAVFGNDSDVENDSLTLTAVSAPAAGTAVILDANAGIIRYTSTGNFSGPISFTYTVSDGNGGSATATASVVIDAIRNGTAGPDVINGTTADDEINGLAGDDTLDGKAGNDTIMGGDGADEIIGGSGNDFLYGNEGNDTITDGDGVDLADGGEGDDTFVVSGVLATGERIQGGNGTDTLELSGNATLTAAAILSSIEAIDFGGNDLTIATTDTLDFSSMTRTGGGTLVGDGSSNSIIGTNQGDIFRGGPGNDSLNGGGGDDLFLVAGGELNGDTLIGGDGSDSIQFTAAVDLTAGFVADASIETLDMGGKVLNATTASLVDLRAIDVLLRSADIRGDASANRIAGTQGSDTIKGDAGGDVLIGAGGNDVLYGGTSTKKGDGAADTFVFNTALNGTSNVDTIYAFEASAIDKIALDQLLFAAIGSALDSTEFRANAGGNAVDSDDFILFDTSTGNLFYDSDGSLAGGKVLFATLLNRLGTLDSTDFTMSLPPGS
jgi:Ca2+-binding RTX toxin-like protein